MEKHKCKLCFRSFSNGRALGGHMRSHMMNLPLSKPEEAFSRTVQLSFEAESASSSSSDDDDDDHNRNGDEDDNDKGLCYGLRENPKRSIRLADHEFSFAGADTSSVILQDRESETESSRNNPTGRRSKRPWNNNNNNNNNNNYYYYYNNNDCNKKRDVGEKRKREWLVEQEPASSVSDATTEEDVAFCLMMLSRDKWRRQKEPELEEQYQEEEEESEEEEDEAFEESDESRETMKLCKTRVRGRYKCETCNKVFRSYQALGGHRASHKKIKVNVKVDEAQHRISEPFGAEKKTHECPVCFRVFASGQALGGHKRTHVTGAAATATVPSTSAKFGNSFIDLNLPAPVDDDDASQIENSAVSDAEFVKTR